MAPLSRLRVFQSQAGWHNARVAEREDMVESYREFIREQTVRFERAMRALSSEIRAEVESQREDFRREFRLQREESRRYFEHLDRRLEELHGESRAQTQALLHVIDRLDNGGAAPAA